MNRFIDVRRSQRIVNNPGEPFNTGLKQALQPGADDIKSQIKDSGHNQDEHRQSGILPGQDAVNLFGTSAFAALLRLFDAGAGDFFNEGEAHISDGGGAVKSAFLFHLGDNVLKHFGLVLIQT